MIAVREDRWAEYRRRIARVARQPERDELRLELAEWLEKTGRDHPLADFIRVDIAYWHALTNSSPATPPDKRAADIVALEEQRQALLDQHLNRWCGPLFKIIGEDENILFRTRRGLIGSIVAAGGIAAQRVVVQGDELLPWAPIDSLCLWSGQESDCESFSVSGRLTIMALTRTRLFWALKSLELSGNWIGRAGVEVLLEAAPPPRLRFLKFRPDDLSFLTEHQLRQRYSRCFISYELERH